MDNITVTLVFIPNNLALQFNPDARRKRIYTWHNDPWVNGWLRENIGHEVMYIGDEVADHYDLTPSLIFRLMDAIHRKREKLWFMQWIPSFQQERRDEDYSLEAALMGIGDYYTIAMETMVWFPRGQQHLSR